MKSGSTEERPARAPHRSRHIASAHSDTSRPHKTGEEFQNDGTRSTLVALTLLLAVFAVGVVLIVRGLV